MNNIYYDIFKKEFPYILREKQTAKNIINNKNNKFLNYKDENKIIAAAIVNENAILLFWVDKDYRNRGIGTKLLQDCEAYIKHNGYMNVVVGVGFDYLMPGVPTNEQSIKADKSYENILPMINNEAHKFFLNRGYFHSWEDANCFDMLMEFKAASNDFYIGACINNISYVWAKLTDIPKIVECCDDAAPEFSQYYKDIQYYNQANKQRVLIAKDKDKIVGALMVCNETEGKNLGSAGCTVVASDYQHQKIATNMIKVATNELKRLGLKTGHIGYTYTGLDKLYGASGYRISMYFFMAQKNLDKKSNMKNGET